MSDVTISPPNQPALQKLWQRARFYASVLRFRAFDTSTTGGRSLERYRRIAITSASSFFAKVIHSAVLFLSVPIAVEYLGKERYGLWMTISSIIAMFGFTDLGLGHGLMSTLSDADGRDDRPDAQRAVSSAFFMLGIVALIAAAAFSVAYPFVHWQSVFGVSSPEAAREAGPALAAFVAIFLLGMPLTVAQSIQTGYQEGFANSIWQAVTSILSFVGLMIAVHYRVSLPWLVLGWTAGTVIAKILNCIQIFCGAKSWLTPSVRLFQWEMASRLLKIGFVFMIINMSLAVGYTSDSLVLAKILGAESVTTYSIVYRLFSIVTVMVSFFLLPLWPAYGEAIARGDIPWVRRTLHRSIIATLAFNGTAGVLLMCFGKWIMRKWVGDAISPTYSLLLPFAIYLLVTGMLGPFSMLLNGMRVVRFQVLCFCMMAVTNLGLSIVLTRHIGVTGVMYGTVVSTLLFLVLPEAWYTRRLLRSKSSPDAA